MTCRSQQRTAALLPWQHGFEGWRRARGLTLIEMLAVVVLASLIAGLGVTRLAAGSELARMRTAIGTVMNLDAKARSIARTGALEVHLNSHEQIVWVQAKFGSVAMAALPQSLSVDLFADGKPVRAVSFDASGRSADYSVELRSAHQTVVLQVLGLTGWAETIEVDS